MTRYIFILFIGLAITLGACHIINPTEQSNSESPVTITYYDWEDDIPVDVLEEFTARTGIIVKYEEFKSSMVAEESILSGEGVYDVVVIDNDSIPILIRHDVLNDIEYENIPNFKYISINFRDLVFDPANQHSIPFNWGTTGLITLKNADFEAPMDWADLWNIDEKVKIGMRGDVPFDNFALTKKVLGIPINECNSDQLQATIQKLILLTPNIVLVDAKTESAMDALQSGKIDILIGWSDDVFAASDRGMDVVYILPGEGTMLWGDSYVIPKNSTHKEEAEKLINYFLEPEIAARILLYNRYASANDRVKTYLPAEIVLNKIIFPDDATLQAAEIYMPINEVCVQEHMRLWNQFIEQID